MHSVVYSLDAVVAVVNVVGNGGGHGGGSGRCDFKGGSKRSGSDSGGCDFVGGSDDLALVLSKLVMMMMVLFGRGL